MADKCTRTVYLPITAAVPGKWTPECPWVATTADWDGFRSAVKVAWRESAQMMTWMVNQLAALDALTNQQSFLTGQLSKFEADIDPMRNQAGRLFPHIDSQSIGNAFQRVRASYLKARWPIHVQCRESLPRFEAPQPVWFATKDYTLFEADGRVYCQIALAEPPTQEDLARHPTGMKKGRNGSLVPADKGKRRWYTVALTQGKDYDWKNQVLRDVIAGRTRPGAASLFRGKRGDLMLAFPVDLPIDTSEKVKDRVLLISTIADGLLQVECQGFRGRRVPFYNEDWLKRKIHHTLAGRLEEGTNTPRKENTQAVELRELITRHGQFCQRFREDLKGAARYNGRCRRRHRKALAARCKNARDQVSDRLHKIATTIQRFALANRVFKVLYDDRCRDFIKPFRWADLRRMIAERMEKAGIAWTHLNAGKEEDGVNHAESNQASEDAPPEWRCPQPKSNPSKEKRRKNNKPGA